MQPTIKGRAVTVELARGSNLLLGRFVLYNFAVFPQRSDFSAGLAFGCFR